MSDRRATCSCGKLSVSARGEPLRISVCHCLACQRRTGSIFGAQARFPASAVEVTGRSRRYTRVADSGNSVTSYFCPDCGATVYYELSAVPGAIGIPIGAFADPAFPAPRVSIYEATQHPWVGLPADIEHLA